MKRCISFFIVIAFIIIAKVEPILGSNSLRPPSALDRQARLSTPALEVADEGWQRIREAKIPIRRAAETFVRLGAKGSVVGYLEFKVTSPGLMGRLIGGGVVLEITLKDMSANTIPGIKPYLLRKDGAACNIGRASENDIVVPSGLSAVSRKHLKVARMGEDVYIVDLNSSQGTYAHGPVTPVVMPQPLGDATATLISRGSVQGAEVSI